VGLHSSVVWNSVCLNEIIKLKSSFTGIYIYQQEKIWKSMVSSIEIFLLLKGLNTRFPHSLTCVIDFNLLAIFISQVPSIICIYKLTDMVTTPHILLYIWIPTKVSPILHVLCMIILSTDFVLMSLPIVYWKMSRFVHNFSILAKGTQSCCFITQLLRFLWHFRFCFFYFLCPNWALGALNLNPGLTTP